MSGTDVRTCNLGSTLWHPLSFLMWVMPQQHQQQRLVLGNCLWQLLRFCCVLPWRWLLTHNLSYHIRSQKPQLGRSACQRNARSFGHADATLQRHDKGSPCREQQLRTFATSRVSTIAVPVMPHQVSIVCAVTHACYRFETGRLVALNVKGCCCRAVVVACVSCLWPAQMRQTPDCPGGAVFRALPSLDQTASYRSTMFILYRMGQTDVGQAAFG
jgi:hypothetical protein